MIDLYLIHKRKEIVDHGTFKVPWASEVNRVKLDVIEDEMLTFRFEVEEEGLPFSFRIPDFAVKVWDEGEIANVLNQFDEVNDILLLEFRVEDVRLHLLVVKKITQSIEPNIYTIQAVGGMELLRDLQEIQLKELAPGSYDLLGFLNFQFSAISDKIFLYADSWWEPIKVIGFDNVIIRWQFFNETIKDKRITIYDFLMFLARQLNAVIFVDRGAFYFVNRNYFIRNFVDIEENVIDGEISHIYNREYDAIMTQFLLIQFGRTSTGAEYTYKSNRWIIAEGENKFTIINADDINEQERIETFKRNKRILNLWNIDLQAIEVASFLWGRDTPNIIVWGSEEQGTGIILHWENILSIVKPFKIATVEVYGLDYQPLDRVSYQGFTWNVLNVEKDFVSETSKLLLYSIEQNNNA